MVRSIRPGGHRHIAPTRLAAQNTRPCGEAVGLARGRTVRAFKPIFPPDLLQIGGASRVIREKPLEFGEFDGNGRSPPRERR